MKITKTSCHVGLQTKAICFVKTEVAAAITASVARLASAVTLASVARLASVAKVARLAKVARRETVI